MVGFLKKFSEKISGSEDMDVDEYLDTLGLEHEHFIEEEADMWVKPYVLQDINDIKAVGADLQSGNIVLLNIEPLYKRNAIKLKQAISQVKRQVEKINGDMVRLSEYKLIATPKGVKVAKTKR